MTRLATLATGLTMLAAAALAGCGVRGSLDLPPDAQAQQQDNAQASSAQGKAAGDTQKPHKGFILDGLLR